MSARLMVCAAGALWSGSNLMPDPIAQAIVPAMIWRNRASNGRRALALLLLPLLLLLLEFCFLSLPSRASAGGLPGQGIGAPVAASTVPGSLDYTFDPAANGTLAGLIGALPLVQTVLPQPDGKVLIGGSFNAVNGSPRHNLARLNADGRLDASFQTRLGPDGSVSAMALQPDGRVLILGGFRTVDAQTNVQIARLNADGSVDASFHCRLEGGPDFGLAGAAVQQSGKIWIGGQFARVNGVARHNLARLNPDGSLDASFDPGVVIAGANLYVTKILLQPDDKLLIGGKWATPERFLVRLNVEGSLDTAFANVVLRHSLAEGIRDLACNSNGTIAIVGLFSSVNGVPRPDVATLNSDGSLDPRFHPGTGPDYNYLSAVALQPDDKVVVGGNFKSFSGVGREGLARLNADGSVDTAFFPGNAAGVPPEYHAQIQDLFIQGDGSVLVASSAWWGQENTNSVFRLGATGDRDPAFAPLLHAPPEALGRMALQADGKVIYGTFGSYTRSRLGRLHPNGLIDDTFVAGTNFGYIHAVRVQPDGRILVATTPVQETQQATVVRLLANGTLDETFHAPMIRGGEAPIETLALQPDGKILVGGLIWEVEANPRQGIVRLHPDGRFDDSFHPVPIGVTDDPGYGVEHILVRPDGKIFIAGGFQSAGGGSSGLALLQPDGTVDPRFAENVQSVAYVYAVAPQPDGKILLSVYSGETIPGLIRINPDGTRDSGFQPAFDGEFFAIAVQPDGQILLATSAPASGRIVRLNANGLLDTAFHVELYPWGADGMLLQPDGQILVSGGFQSVAGVPRQGIARLHNEVKWRLDPRLQPDGSCQVQISGRPGARLIIEASSDLTGWSQLDEVTTGLAPVTYVDSDAARFSPRFYRTRAAED